MIETAVKYGLSALPEARTIREEVFIREQGFAYEYDELDESSWHVLVTVDGVPAATGRTFPKDGVYKIGRVAVLKPYRKQGIGRVVMDALEVKARELGALKCVLSSQVQARGFYEKLGYTAEGEVYLEEDCPHIFMIREL